MAIVKLHFVEGVEREREREREDGCRYVYRKYEVTFVEIYFALYMCLYA